MTTTGNAVPIFVLGFDPSTEGAAWALLSVSRASRSLVKLGTADGDEGIREAILGGAVHANARGIPLRVAVERPAGLHIHGEGIAAARARAAALMKTSRVAGYIVATAERFGLKAVEVSPEGWRRGVVGKAQASDAVIKQVIRGLVTDWPTRSSNHLRDAAGVSLAVGLAR